MIIFGKNTVREALIKHKNITKIYACGDSFLLELKSKNISIPKVEVLYLKPKQMDELTKGNHQGIACEIEDYQYVSLDSIIKKNKNMENVSLIMLDGLEDPHNLGAILRTADATGMEGIIIPKNRCVGLNSTVAKVSTGAIEYVDVCQVTNLVQAIKKLKEEGYWIIGLEMEGSVDYKSQDYRGKIVVVIGSEGRGISRLVKDECDYMINIPMIGHVTSLNASVSASIIFYEILRQRG